MYNTTATLLRCHTFGVVSDLLSCVLPHRKVAASRSARLVLVKRRALTYALLRRGFADPVRPLDAEGQHRARLALSCDALIHVTVDMHPLGVPFEIGRLSSSRSSLRPPPSRWAWPPWS